MAPPPTSPNPTHNYPNKGPYTPRKLTVSDGTNSVQSAPIAISVGIKPVAAITTPSGAGPLFRGGDVIAYSGTGTDTEERRAAGQRLQVEHRLPARGTHPPRPSVTGTKSGTFTIPTSGHDFHGLHPLPVSPSPSPTPDGLTAVQSGMTVFPDKTNITLDSSPRGMPLRLDSLPT
jgi:hypothetical protein